MAKRCDMALDPSPAICGKTNHIQWLVLRPRPSSSRTLAMTGPWAVTKRSRSKLCCIEYHVVVAEPAPVGSVEMQVTRAGTADGHVATEMVDFENRSEAHFSYVSTGSAEPPFAGRLPLNISRPYSPSVSANNVVSRRQCRSAPASS